MHLPGQRYGRARVRDGRPPELLVRDGAAPCYQRRRPEQTLLHRLVAEHLETFLAGFREAHDQPLPRYVEKELRAFLDCGILSRGFALAECRSCGRRIAVAFSCKRRGVCGSCIARRMADGAAHLVDHVFPAVPVRQWVLSVPFEIRLLLARDAAAYGAVTRLFAEEVMRFKAHYAVAIGIAEQACSIRAAGVSAQQRWGSSLNLNPHVHAAWCDGVFTRGAPGERAVFHALPAPTSAELERVVVRIHERTRRYLAYCGLLRGDPEDESNAAADPTPIESCLGGAIGVAGLTRIDPRQILHDLREAGGSRDTRADPRANPDAGSGADADAERFGRRFRGPHVADALGFSLHAATTVPEDDHDALERLLRYFTRPPLARDRLFLLRDGRVAYALRKPWRGDQTHRVMTPLALLARLAALVPPPRHPILRFHGAFAPNSSWRRAVVPLTPPRPNKPPWDVSSHSTPCSTEAASTAKSSNATPPNATPPNATLSNPASVSASAPLPASKRGVPPMTWRLDWATLLWRVHAIDALRCECGGRLRFTELITDRAEACKRLSALSLDGAHDAPTPLPKARDPTFDDGPWLSDWDAKAPDCD